MKAKNRHALFVIGAVVRVGSPIKAKERGWQHLPQCAAVCTS
jgi:hypothetical protein